MPQHNKSKVNLKTVADRVGLAPCSVSAVLNNTPASRTIPQATKDRIFRAASELNYRPDFWARSLRTRRTRMVAVVTNDFGNSAVARVVSAAQDKLHRRGYLLVLGSLGSSDLGQFPVYLRQRGIEGIIAIDAELPATMDLPVVAVDLTYLSSTEMFGTGLESWLRDLGTSAADTVVAEIDGTRSETPLQTKRATGHLESNQMAARP